MTRPLDPGQHALLKQGWLATFDPGLRHPAAAVFYNGALVSASRVKVPGEVTRLPRGERIRHIGQMVAMWINDTRVGTSAVGAGYTWSRWVGLVAEFPQVYRAAQSKGDPNDLMPLAALVGAVAARLDCECIAPLPKEWIGQTPKSETGDPWDSPRGRLVKGRLTAVELANVQATHDSVDAAGLGLWAVGRLERNYPGAV